MRASHSEPSLLCRGRAPLIAITLWAAALCVPVGSAASAQSPPGPRDTTLANGLRVMVLEDHAVPLSTVLVAVRNGAFTQRPGEQGIAHLYEHMLFRTYKGNPSKFAEDASSLRAVYNGQTEEDVVFYFMMLPSRYTGHAIQQLARLVSRAVFRKRDLNDEEPVVLDELARDASDPVGELRRAEGRDLWGSDWYRKDVGGDSTSVRQVTLDRLQAYFDRYYVPNNAALIVTGDVNTEDVFKEAAHRFEKWQRAEDPFAGTKPASMIPLARSRVMVTTSDATEATIRIELQGPGLTSDSAGVKAMDALVELLGSQGSPFLRDMVVNGPFRELNCGFEKSRSAGTLVFQGSTDPQRASEAATLLADTLNNIEGYLKGPDIAREKLRELDRALVLERRATLAPYMAELWARGEALDLSGEVDRATNAELVRVARTYLEGKPRVIGVIVPETMAAAVRADLERKEGLR